MANRTFYEVNTVKSDTVIATARFVGNGTSDPTLPDATKYGGGEIATITRTGTGTFSITFRKKYPQLLAPLRPCIIGTTAGLDGRYTAFDPAAGTATLVLEVNTTATDPSTADTVHLVYVLRNSGKNQ